VRLFGFASTLTVAMLLSLGSCILITMESAEFVAAFLIGSIPKNASFDDTFCLNAIVYLIA